MVEWGALEKHCIILIVPRVRIPLSPLVLNWDLSKSKLIGVAMDSKAGTLYEFVQSTRQIR